MAAFFVLLLLFVVLGLVLNLGHGHGLEAALHLAVFELVEFVLAHFVDDAGADGVAQDVDGGSEPEAKEARSKLGRSF